MHNTPPRAPGPLIDWVALYGACWRDLFDALEDLLNGMDQ